MTTTPTAQELEHMIADGKIKLGARPAPVAPTAQEANEALTLITNADARPTLREEADAISCLRTFIAAHSQPEPAPPVDPFFGELERRAVVFPRKPSAPPEPESAAPDEICPQCGEYSVAKFSPCPKCGIFGKREPKAESASPAVSDGVAQIRHVGRGLLVLFRGDTEVRDVGPTPGIGQRDRDEIIARYNAFPALTEQVASLGVELAESHKTRKQLFDAALHHQDGACAASRVCAMSWRPIETAPNDATLVQWYVPGSPGMAAYPAGRADDYWCLRKGARSRGGAYWLDGATHWRPLLPPIEGTVTDPATAAASQLATGEPKAQNTEGEGREG